MSPTTDDFPGPNIAEELQLEDRTTDGNPTVTGAVRFVNDDVVVKLSSGVVSMTESAGGGITETQHEALDTVTHNLTETHNVVVTRSSGKISEILAETTGGTDIRKTEILTRSSGKVATFRVTHYESDGSTVKRQLDYTVNRSGGQVTSINVVRTT
jgi:hypothetical protein